MKLYSDRTLKLQTPLMKPVFSAMLKNPRNKFGFTMRDVRHFSQSKLSSGEEIEKEGIYRSF